MKSKKLLLGSLSAMALVATPIATVVSCGKKDSATTATESKVSIVKATTDDYVLTYKTKNYLVSKADAAKAGSFVAGAETITWDKALSAKDVKFKNGEDDASVTSAKATADHFGLKTETGTQYLDATALKSAVSLMLATESGFKTSTGITLKFDDQKKIVKASLDELNKILKPGSLELETVTTDDSGMLKLKWKSAATTGGTGTGTNTGGNGQTGSTATADNAAIKVVVDKLHAITFTGVTVDGIKAKTAGLGVATTLDEIKAFVTKTDGTTAAVLTKTGTGTFPTPQELTGVTLTVKSVDTLAAAGTANITITVAKGQGTAVDTTIAITLA